MVNTEKLSEILSAMAGRMETEKQFLTDLDNEIGDGDHGINMAKGFAAVTEKLPQLNGQKPGAVLKTVGMTLVSAVGGSSGPLYGTAFMRAGMTLGEKESISMDDFLACLKEGTAGIMARGHAVQGEKTMLDAMIPAQDAMMQAAAEGKTPKDVLSAGIKAAADGVKYTKTIIATKGRASYIGERSLGHQDPGATSFTFLLEEIGRVL